MGSRANHMAARTNLCKASGQDGAGTARIGNGLLFYPSLTCPPGALARQSRFPQIRKAQARLASLPESCWCDMPPTPQNPVLISRGDCSPISMVHLYSPGRPRLRPYQVTTGGRKKWRDGVSAPLPDARHSRLLLSYKLCETRSGADFSKRPSFSDVINCVPRKTAVTSARAALARNG